MKLQKSSVITACIVVFSILSSIGFAHAGENDSAPTAGGDIDRWVGEARFQFVPNPLQAEENQVAAVQGYFNKTPGFPLWLMMDMGGALPVDSDHFAVNSMEKDSDGVWILDLSCVDSVNGFFQLHFAIDSKNGDAALKVATATEGDIAMYQGKVGPYEGPGMPDFKNEKRTEEAMRKAAELDTLIPSMQFSIKLNSELYGPKSQINIWENQLRLWDPRQFRGAYEVVCCEKQNGIWYVRLQLVEGTEVSEAVYLDLAIDSWTGEVNYRRGFADRLRLNWRAIVDGKVTGRSDASVLMDRAGKKMSKQAALGMERVE